MALYTLLVILLLVTTGSSNVVGDNAPDNEVDLGQINSVIENFKSHLKYLKDNAVFLDKAKDTYFVPVEELKNIDEAIARLNVTVTEHHNDVVKLTTKFNTYSRTVNETLYRHELQVQKLEPQLAILETQVQNQTTNLAQLQEDWDYLGTKVDERDNDIGMYDRKLTNLEQKFEEQSRTVLGFKQTVLQLETDVNEVQSNNEQFTSFILNLNVNQQGLEEQVSNLVNEVNQLKTTGVKTVAVGDGTKLCNSWYKKST